MGEWKDGKHHEGTYTFADGRKYVGGWKGYSRHGQGTLTHADGRIDNGIWEYDKLVKRNEIQTKIVKKEPTQTQQVAEKEIESITVKAKSKYRHSAAISINEGCKKALERAKLKAIENAFGMTISSAASSYDDVILHGTIKELKKLSQIESHEVLSNGLTIYTCNVEIEAKVIKNIETQTQQVAGSDNF